jgi:hypothetical protein
LRLDLTGLVDHGRSGIRDIEAVDLRPEFDPPPEVAPDLRISPDEFDEAPGIITSRPELTVPREIISGVVEIHQVVGVPDRQDLGIPTQDERQEIGIGE